MAYPCFWWEIYKPDLRPTHWPGLKTSENFEILKIINIIKIFMKQIEIKIKMFADVDVGEHGVRDVVLFDVPSNKNLENIYLFIKFEENSK